jgi:hypothetical protein
MLHLAQHSITPQLSPPGLHDHRQPFPPLPALQMVQLFGSTRDQWIEKDLKGWLAPNRIYPDVAGAVRAALAKDEAYIVTTKQVGRAGLAGQGMTGALAGRFSCAP